MTARKSIQPAFIFRVCLLSLITAAVFVLMNFLFLFVVEDEFLDRSLRAEKAKLERIFAETGKWPQPNAAEYVVYLGVDQLPDGIGEQLAEEPDRREFYGLEGRHYHLTRLRNQAFLVAEVSDQLIVRPMRKGLILVYGFLTLSLTGLACFVAYRTARKTIAPIVMLADHVTTISPETAPEPFADQYPDNEIGVLARELEKSLQRLHGVLDREKQFSRDVSHDLRTPLAVASGVRELLAKDGLSGRDKQAMLERQKNALSHMELTITALLSLVRDDTQQMAKRQPLLEIVEKTILHYSHLLDGKDVELDIQVSIKARIEAADGVLEILLSNILSNAFQYTSTGVIKVIFNDNRLSIQDTGVGVPDEVRSSLFEAQAKSDHSSGYGLGLSIVSRICAQHNIGLKVDHLQSGTAVHLAF